MLPKRIMIRFSITLLKPMETIIKALAKKRTEFHMYKIKRKEAIE
jgi:hypothetical protein